MVRIAVLPSSPFDGFVSQHGGTPRRGMFGMVVHELGRRIVGGEFPPNGPLPREDALIAELKVSRTTVREAMKSLAAKGMVEIRTKTGTRVRDRAQWHHTDPDVMVWHYETGPSRAFLEQLADLRRVLEPAAASRAAQRASKTEIAAIAAAYAEMCDSIGDPERHSTADCAFHAAIFAATHNVIMGRLIDTIAIGIFGNAVKSTKAVVEGQRMSLPYHAEVLAAIEARDPVRAAAAATSLLDSWHPEPDRARLTKRER